MDERRERIEAQIMRQWYRDGATATLRTVIDRITTLEATLQSLVEQLPQPNLDDPDLDNAVDAAHALLAEARAD